MNRLLEEHPKRSDIQQDLIKLLTGYKGEKALTYYLDFLPKKDFHIFHNLRLPSGKYHFQLDYLLISRRFAIILECKNFFGTLFFDESFKQLIRTANDQEEGFPDPISQAKWHKQQLQVWLQEHNLPFIPIEYLVIISNPSTIVKTDSRSTEVKKRVVHSQIFLERLEEIGGKFRKEVIEEKSLRKLTKLLLKSDVPDDRDVLTKYGIARDEIISGVQCPKCDTFAMIRKQRKWFCPNCGIYDKSTHIESVRDYFLLFDSSITNHQFRDFVHLTSIDMASKLLIRMDLPFSGSNKGRKYYPPPNLY